jgi:hypothetical protein
MDVYAMLRLSASAVALRQRIVPDRREQCPAELLELLPGRWRIDLLIEEFHCAIVADRPAGASSAPRWRRLLAGHSPCRFDGATASFGG